MKKRGIDTAIEIDRLLEEYNPYYDAQINFLFKRMVRENDRRQYDYKKKIEQIRKDFREGRGQFADQRQRDWKFPGRVKPPWEIEEEKRAEERKRLLYGRLAEAEGGKEESPDGRAGGSAGTDEAPE